MKKFEKQKLNCIIIGTGKIGIDLYLKCRKSKKFNKIRIFNRRKNSEGAKYCIKKKFNYSSKGIEGVVNNLKDTKIIFDATSAKSNMLILKKIKKLIKHKYFINLTPSKNGEYIVPYTNKKKVPRIVNLITCGGQTSIPIISEVKRILNTKLKYVELVSSIASKSAGKATRDNIDEYIINTEKAVKKLTKINKVKVIININPSEPPVNMMNSLFFELKSNIDKKIFKKIENAVNKINKRIKVYIPQYNAKLFKSVEKNIIRITIRVVGQGDYLPTYAGNLDIITSSAVYLSKFINEKK
jgi:acetaldehyde dehydrogenase